MAIATLEAASRCASSQLDDWGTVGLPLSQPPCRLRGLKIAAAQEGGPETGIWECTPGRYRRQIRSAETMHILSGEAVFTPDDGEPVTLQAGDVLHFEAESMGVWDIRVTLRKVYVVFEPLR